MILDQRLCEMIRERKHFETVILYRSCWACLDVNAGSMVEGKSLEALRAEMIDVMVRVINGEKTRAERNGMDVCTWMTVHPPF